MLKPYRYWKSCMDLEDFEVVQLGTMVACQWPITFDTLLSHCDGVQDWAVEHGYETDRRRGLVLNGDPLVGFYRSRWRGERCYFIRRSAIEFIWRKGGW